MAGGQGQRGSRDRREGGGGGGGFKIEYGIVAVSILGFILLAVFF